MLGSRFRDQSACLDRMFVLEKIITPTLIERSLAMTGTGTNGGIATPPVNSSRNAPHVSKGKTWHCRASPWKTFGNFNELLVSRLNWRRGALSERMPNCKRANAATPSVRGCDDENNVTEKPGGGDDSKAIYAQDVAKRRSDCSTSRRREMERYRHSPSDLGR